MKEVQSAKELQTHLNTAFRECSEKLDQEMRENQEAYTEFVESLKNQVKEYLSEGAHAYANFLTSIHQRNKVNDSYH